MIEPDSHSDSGGRETWRYADLSGPGRWLGRLALVRAGEGRALLWSASYFFCLLFAYYLLRPMRDAMGIRGDDLDELPWLWTGTTVAMLAASPVFAALVARLPRRRFIPIVYRFFAVNLVVLFALFRWLPREHQLALGYAFYIWLSVFNLFAVSVFWGFMADAWTTEQGRRLFGAIGVGGTLGAICGSSIPAHLADRIGPALLLLLAAGMLELAVQCVRRLYRLASARLNEPTPPLQTCAQCHYDLTGLRPADDGTVVCPECGQLGQVRTPRSREPGPSPWAGLVLIARSTYLQQMVLYMLLFTVTTTFLYFTQAGIIQKNYPDEAQRIATFAKIDQATSLLTLVTQLFGTGRLLTRFGVGMGLALLPALTLAGFALLAARESVAVLVGFLVLRRAMHYAVDRPTREVLYTVLGPDAKYKSKSFIDTFIYRGGDLAGAWLTKLGASVVMLAIPAAAAWWLTSLLLARQQRRLARLVSTSKNEP